MYDAAFLATLLTALPAAQAQSAHTQSAHTQPAHTQSSVAHASTTPDNGNHAHEHPVAAHDLARGDVLKAADIQWVSDSAFAADGRFSRAAFSHASSADTLAGVAPGWVARRPIRAGEPLIAPSVSRPTLINNGDAVDIVYRDDGVAIKLRGIAIGRGASGDEIYVKLDNRRRLRGIVESATTVRIL